MPPAKLATDPVDLRDAVMLRHPAGESGRHLDHLAGSKELVEPARKWPRDLADSIANALDRRVCWPGITSRLMSGLKGTPPPPQASFITAAVCITLRSACTISRASSRTLVSWLQPSFCLALLGSPSSSSTSVGRK